MSSSKVEASHAGAASLKEQQESAVMFLPLDVMGNLLVFLKTRKAKQTALFAQISRREQGKSQRKNRREKDRTMFNASPNNDIDFQKSLAFTEIWHNNNDFNVVLTKQCQNAKKYESCKVEFAREALSAFLKTSRFCTRKDTCTPRWTTRVK